MSRSTFTRDLGSLPFDCASDLLLDAWSHRCLLFVSALLPLNLGALLAFSDQPILALSHLTLVRSQLIIQHINCTPLPAPRQQAVASLSFRPGLLFCC